MKRAKQSAHARKISEAMKLYWRKRKRAAKAAVKAEPMTRRTKAA